MLFEELAKTKLVFRNIDIPKPTIYVLAKVFAEADLVNLSNAFKSAPELSKIFNNMVSVIELLTTESKSNSIAIAYAFQIIAKFLLKKPLIPTDITLYEFSNSSLLINISKVIPVSDIDFDELFKSIIDNFKLLNLIDNLRGAGFTQLDIETIFSVAKQTHRENYNKALFYCFYAFFINGFITITDTNVLLIKYDDTLINNFIMASLFFLAFYKYNFNDLKKFFIILLLNIL